MVSGGVSFLFIFKRQNQKKHNNDIMCQNYGFDKIKLCLQKYVRHFFYPRKIILWSPAFCKTGNIFKGFILSQKYVMCNKLKMLAKWKENCRKLLSPTPSHLTQHYISTSVILSTHHCILSLFPDIPLLFMEHHSKSTD